MWLGNTKGFGLIFLCWWHSSTFISPTKNATSAIDRQNSCLCGVKNWLDSNKLIVNGNKSEFIFLVPKGIGIYCGNFSLCIFSRTSLNQIFSLKSGSVFWLSIPFHQCRKFVKVILHSSGDILLLALVSSRLDHCHSFYRRLLKFNLHKLQCL